jgi:hypothetical protein
MITRTHWRHASLSLIGTSTITNGTSVGEWSEPDISRLNSDNADGGDHMTLATHTPGNVRMMLFDLSSTTTTFVSPPRTFFGGANASILDFPTVDTVAIAAVAALVTIGGYAHMKCQCQACKRMRHVNRADACAVDFASWLGIISVQERILSVQGTNELLSRGHR